MIEEYETKLASLKAEDSLAIGKEDVGDVRMEMIGDKGVIV